MEDISPGTWHTCDIVLLSSTLTSGEHTTSKLSGFSTHSCVLLSLTIYSAYRSNLNLSTKVLDSVQFGVDRTALGTIGAGRGHCPDIARHAARLPSLIVQQGKEHWIVAEAGRSSLHWTGKGREQVRQVGARAHRLHRAIGALHLLADWTSGRTLVLSTTPKTARAVAARIRGRRNRQLHNADP